MAVATKVKVRLSDEGIIRTTDRALLVELCRINGMGADTEQFWIPKALFVQNPQFPLVATVEFNHWYRQFNHEFWLAIVEKS